MPILSFEDMKKRVAENLKTAVGTVDFDVTSAKLDEMKRIWSVHVEYKKPKAEFSETAFVMMDAETGEVKEFRNGM
jgi:hypothetical protein